MRKLLVIALAAMVAGCASVRLKVGADKDGEVVEAEGWSPLDPKDILGTKERSLAEAQKKAVEQVVGVYISAKTRVSQAIHVDQNILANVGGYIQKYDVIGEKQEDGFYKTRIRAFVLYKKVGEDLKALGLVRPDAPPGNPQVLVVLAAKNGSPQDQDFHAAAAVRRVLVERGFSVLDGESAARYGADKSTASALAAGKSLRADLVIRGESEAYPLEDARLGDFHSYRARVSLEAVLPVTSQVVSRKAQEASGLDPTDSIAREKALENAGQMAGESLASELAELLKTRVEISLIIVGVGNMVALKRIEEDIRLLPEVSAVTLADYRKEGASLKVTTEKMTGDQLAAELLRLKKYSFTVRAVTPYAVEVSLGEI